MPLIRALQSVCRQIVLHNREVKGEGRRALSEKRHTCSTQFKEPQSWSESNLLPLTFFFFSLSSSLHMKGQMTPFLLRPVRPAAGGSESHFLSPPQGTSADMPHKQETALSLTSPDMHTAHVKTRQAGRCARLSWSGWRYTILSLCRISCHPPTKRNYILSRAPVSRASFSVNTSALA